MNIDAIRMGHNYHDEPNQFFTYVICDMFPCLSVWLAGWLTGWLAGWLAAV